MCDILAEFLKESLFLFAALVSNALAAAFAAVLSCSSPFFLLDFLQAALLTFHSSSTSLVNHGGWTRCLPCFGLW